MPSFKTSTFLIYSTDLIELTPIFAPVAFLISVEEIYTFPQRGYLGTPSPTITVGTGLIIP